eukprot:96175-Rhodomonas_salina.1
MEGELSDLCRGAGSHASSLIVVREEGSHARSHAMDAHDLGVAFKDTPLFGPLATGSARPHALELRARSEERGARSESLGEMGWLVGCFWEWGGSGEVVLACGV